MFNQRVNKDTLIALTNFVNLKRNVNVVVFINIHKALTDCRIRVMSTRFFFNFVSSKSKV